jgi:cytochrome c biogenesis protein CcdA
MIWQRVFNVIATIAGLGIAFLALGTGSYLVWSVTPDWLIKAVGGVVLILLGGTIIGSIARATSQALDVSREH